MVCPVKPDGILYSEGCAAPRYDEVGEPLEEADSTAGLEVENEVSCDAESACPESNLPVSKHWTTSVELIIKPSAHAEGKSLLNEDNRSSDSETVHGFRPIVDKSLTTSNESPLCEVLVEMCCDRSVTT